MSAQLNHFYEFGPFRLDPTERLLLRDGKPIELTPKAFEVLLVLAKNSGHLLDKDQLLKQVWPDTAVEENNLTQAIYTLRRALGDDKEGNKIIETVPRRGYRFVAGVQERAKPAGKPVAGGIAGAEASLAGGKLPGDLSARPRPRSAAIKAGVAAGAVLLLALGAWSFRSLVAAKAHRPISTSLVVLPFENLGAEPGDQYLSDGLSEELTTSMAQVPGLRVVARTSAYQFRGKGEDVRRIGTQLGVGAVLEGSLSRTGQKLRITAQLINAQDGYHIWSQAYGGDVGDFLRIEQQVAEAATRALGMPASAAPVSAAAGRKENAQAYDLYLQGRFLWNKRTTDAMKGSIALYQQAIQLDPAFAQAYAGLGDTYVVMAVNRQLPAVEAVQHAKDAARKALELDPQMAEPHATLGLVKSMCEWDWQGGEAEFQRALELNPSYATAHHWAALNLMAMGRFEEAAAELRKAQVLDPLSIMITYSLGENFYYWRRYDDVLEQGRRIAQMDPRDVRAHDLLARGYEGKGMPGEAVAEFRDWLAKTDDQGVAAQMRLRMYLDSGDIAAARREAAEMTRAAKTESTLGYALAGCYALLGEKQAALDWLDRAYEVRDPDLASLKVDPNFDSLHSEPRYLELLKKVGLNGK
jgi:TolB-like protein/DNA-binding winged helix-turn-helix (wHTH) protein/cytochrome c-type biogenesis protein CcmH/NrfG